MAVGDGIKHHRNMRGMTQKELGLAIGFDDKSADVRIAQYETGKRTPKLPMLNTIANVLNVKPEALDEPDMNSYVGVAHILFALEDLYGLKINSIDGAICLTPDKFKHSSLREMLRAWQKEAEKLESGEITEDEYNTWRYNYPLIEAERFAEQRKLFREKNNKSKE
jgi:transcriptional regulator with XRE-family HTH domain